MTFRILYKHFYKHAYITTKPYEIENNKEAQNNFCG